MIETKPKRRWFRFSLRTLLIVVAAAAMASWGYWVGWPWWSLHREQMFFETEVQKLKVGKAQLYQVLPDEQNARRTYSRLREYNASMDTYLWPNAAYYIIQHYDYEGTDGWDAVASKIDRIEVFRLPASPRTDLHDQSHEEFFRMICSDRKNTKGFQYELIYSDPLAKSIK
jgi:hypothetical protein